MIENYTMIKSTWTPTLTERSYLFKYGRSTAYFIRVGTLSYY